MFPPATPPYILWAPFLLQKPLSIATCKGENYGKKWSNCYGSAIMLFYGVKQFDHFPVELLSFLN
jgi:hypothetical protein